MRHTHADHGAANVIEKQGVTASTTSTLSLSASPAISVRLTTPPTQKHISQTALPLGFCRGQSCSCFTTGVHYQSSIFIDRLPFEVVQTSPSYPFLRLLPALSHERQQVMRAGDGVALWTAPDSPSATEAWGRVKQGGLVLGHRVGHESQGVSTVRLLELSVKRTTAQGFASGVYSVFDLCVRCFITQLYCNTHTVPSLVEILNKPL